MRKFVFNKEKNLILINFINILAEISPACLNDLDTYGLITDYRINLSDRDTKKLIYHHIIHGICEEIQKTTHKHRKVIVIPPRIDDSQEIVQFCHPEEFSIFLTKLLKSLQNLLPVVLFQSDEDLFSSENIDSGKMQDILSIMSQLCHIKDSRNFTFERMKKFSSKFDLDFLSNSYFNSIKTKMLLH